ncbi:hypothetical protein K7459_12815 [Pseudomonas fluorescens]|uniref:Uncharacterized protein n=1 Tax=Pseudomonas fluorescens (strain Pf0-1) TaxID=205922 RepID=Q3KAH4_PSEPF|nr:hypothetical protein [Pseudomonas fluorescens]ABA75230.1 hypothetical protein Pfl01_3492 [Pseudomonas fluorescens Pf0-1]MBY9024548.1 hypothetical protein [Pseudomonas fluorescens]MBY9030937.1 hypothetical protein [Pseudomonas fluorescens]MBY9036940.1 hypothetical protein [Pseudomonas fluorescens]MBY9043046.1 hypothetical protein [Pseudomonas fluorescens]
MTLTIRKHDKQELQAYIDAELACYAIRLDGVDIDTSAQPDTLGNFPRKHFLGAIEQIVGRNLFFAMSILQERLEQGYKIFLSHTCTPDITHTGAGVLYVTKPEALQDKDKAKIITEVTATYEADIDAHNDKVFEQERAAMLIEEEEARKAVLAEEARKVEADIEKRVQQRLRGMRGAK